MRSVYQEFKSYNFFCLREGKILNAHSNISIIRLIIPVSFWWSLTVSLLFYRQIVVSSSQEEVSLLLGII